MTEYAKRVPKRVEEAKTTDKIEIEFEFEGPGDVFQPDEVREDKGVRETELMLQLEFNRVPFNNETRRIENEDRGRKINRNHPWRSIYER